MDNNGVRIRSREFTCSPFLLPFQQPPVSRHPSIPSLPFPHKTWRLLAIEFNPFRRGRKRIRLEETISHATPNPTWRKPIFRSNSHRKTWKKRILFLSYSAFINLSPLLTPPPLPPPVITFSLCSFSPSFLVTFPSLVERFQSSPNSKIKTKELKVIRGLKVKS